MSGPQGRPLIGWAAVAVLVIFFVVDVSFKSVMLIPLIYIVVVGVTALTAGPRATAVVASIAFLLALLAGFFNGDHTSRTYWLRVAVVCVVAIVALSFSAVLATRERRTSVAAERFRLIAENVSDVVLVWGADGRLTWVSPSVLSVLGWEPEDLIGQEASALLDESEIDRIRAYHRDVYAQGEVSGRMEARYRTADGRYRWMSVDGRAQLDDAGTVIGGIESLRDVQSEVDARTALVESEAQYRLLAENTSDIVIRWDDGARVVWVTSSVEAVLGWKPQDLIGRHISELMFAEDMVRISELKKEILARGEVDGNVEARYATADGGWRWMAVRGHAIVDDDGRLLGGVEGLRDIEIEHSYRERLRFLAGHDALSQLANRGEFLAQMGKLLHHETRSGDRFALLFIDIDEFKSINDTWGHEAGDIVISELARRISACVRTDDLVARYGGDEFVAALTAVHDIDDARAVADKIQVAVRDPIILNSHAIRVTVSIGIALVEPGEGLSESLRRADLAVYAAKSHGRNRSVTYEQAIAMAGE